MLRQFDASHASLPTSQPFLQNNHPIRTHVEPNSIIIDFKRAIKLIKMVFPICTNSKVNHTYYNQSK